LTLTQTDSDKEFARLYKKYFTRSFAFLYTYLKSKEPTQDLAQEVWMKIHVKRERLAEIENFEAYLFTICRNAGINEYKRVKAKADNLIAFEQQASFSGKAVNDGETDLLEDQYLHKLKAFLGKQDYDILILHIQGFGYKEISKKLKIPEGTVSNRKTKILQLIRENRKWLFDD